MHTDRDPTPPDPARRVAVFFYGSFIRREVMARGGLRPGHIEVARLSGFDIHVDPHACITRSGEHSIYGILVQASHDELKRLYTMDGVGVFLPEAVVVEVEGGRLQPAMCYIPPARQHQPADLDYLALLVAAAREHGFPAAYIARLEALAH
jgi:AIG2 family protein